MARKEQPPRLETLLKTSATKALRHHDLLSLGARFSQALAIVSLGLLTAWLVQSGSIRLGYVIVMGICALAYLGLGWMTAQSCATLCTKLLPDLQSKVVRAWLCQKNDVKTLSQDQIGQGVLVAQQEVRHALDHRLQFRPLAFEMRLLLPALLIVVALIHWPSAVTLMLITPAMIAFMALVGLMLGDKAKAEQDALHHMAGSFADKMRCLPTIVSLGWEKAMAEDLDTQAKAYGTKAFALIQVAFLNASVLDFFASLSVAIVAVFLGLGHLGLATMPGFGDVSLAQSLPVLILSVEFFQPFRRLSASYHLKAKGEAALKFLENHCNVQVTHEVPWGPLTLPYTHEEVKIELPKTGMIALVGPSGSGKSTLLNALFGLVDPLRGTVPDLGPDKTLFDTTTYVTSEDLCLRDHRVLSDIPANLTDPACLSGGQRLRLGLMKAIEGGSQVLGLDEPTAKLDQGIAAKVREILKEQAQWRLVLVATHDADLIALADQVLHLGVTKNNEEQKDILCLAA